jgi:hypothetical protein
MHEHREGEVLSANGDAYLLVAGPSFTRGVDHSKWLYNELSFGLYKDCLMLQHTEIDSSPIYIFGRPHCSPRLMKQLIAKIWKNRPCSGPRVTPAEMPQGRGRLLGLQSRGVNTAPYKLYEGGRHT